jgi:rhodanese-related sulfurtransferase
MVRELGPKDVETLLKAGPSKTYLLDVREVEERETARIEPSAHIPVNEIPARLPEIPKDRTVIVYCHLGARSSMVAGYLESEGYQDVVNLEGGIEAWSAEVDPKVPRYSW